MKKIYFLLLTLLISSMSFGQLVINEIDSDTPGSDTAEFLELKWTPNTSLDGYIVVFFNGSNDLSYATIDLTGKSTDTNGFFILANESLATGDDIVIPAGGSGFIQNGADAVAIYQDFAANFPNGTAPTTTNLIDALVYDTSDADDTGLLTGLGETIQYDENVNAAGQTESIQRNLDGTYTTKAPTFRAENDSAVCELSLTTTSATCDAFTVGVDTYTATVAFTGGSTSSYVVSADSGTVGGDDPALVASGTIIVTGIAEGTDVVISVTDGGLCDLESTITSPTCIPSNTLPLYEPFNYTVGSQLIDAANWSNISSSTDEVLVGGPGGLSYSILDFPSGNHLAFDGIGSDPAVEFTPVTSGFVYASFLFNVTDQTLASDIADGGYFVSLGDNGAFRARLWVRANPGTSDTTFDIGLSNSGSNPDFGSTLYNVGETLMVVMSYDTATGNMNAWVNPSEADLISITAPAATISSVLSAAPGSINQFIIRQDSASETPFILFDELRIGTTWDDVTPTTLSNEEFNVANFSIYPNPSSNGFVNITSTNADAMSVTVFDVLGKQVINTTINNNRLDVSSLNTGLYVVKISQNNATITKKLIIE
jgi:hypothetical protein